MAIYCSLIPRVLAVVFLFVSVSSGYGQLDDCKCMPVMLPEDSWFLVDTTEWDTCGVNLGSNDCRQVVKQLFGDDFLNRMYARGPWFIQFPDSAFLVPRAPVDTILYVDWRTINPRYSALKTALGDVEQRFGSIQLQKINPDFDTGRYSQSYMLRFQIVGTIHAESAESALIALPGNLSLLRHFGPFFLESVPRLSDALEKLELQLTLDGYSLVVYPPSIHKSLDAIIVNSLGEVVVKFNIDPATSTYVDIRGFPRGAYFVASESALGKFIISK